MEIGRRILRNYGAGQSVERIPAGMMLTGGSVASIGVAFEISLPMSPMIRVQVRARRRHKADTQIGVTFARKCHYVVRIGPSESCTPSYIISDAPLPQR